MGSATTKRWELAEMNKPDKFGDLNQEYNEYCSKYLQPINDEDGIDIALGKAKYNIEVAAEIAKQLIRAKFEQVLEERKTSE